MLSETWTFIANPISGQGKALGIIPKLIEPLKALGIHPLVEWTTGAGQAEIIASHAINNGINTIIACGGDGTIHEVVNGIMKSEKQDEVKMGIIPLGRCNDFASTFHIPKKLPEIVSYLKSKRFQTVDLGCVNDRFFTTVATLGFDSEVNRFVSSRSSPIFRRGTLAYIYGIFASLFRYKDVWVTFKSDLWEFSGKIFLAATANTPTYAGRMKIAPTAVVDDGHLDMCMVKSVSRFEVLRMFPKVFSGGHISHPAVSMQRVTQLEITAEEELLICADGEAITKTPAIISIAPSALQVLVP